MSDQWYYFANGRKLGPVSLGSLKQLADEGVIRSDSEIFREGMRDWVAAREVPELFGGTAASSDACAPESYRSSYEPEPADYGRRPMRSEPPAASGAKPNFLPWVVGGGIAFFLLVCTGIGVVVILGKEKEDERRHREEAQAAHKRIDEEHQRRLKELDKEHQDNVRKINEEARKRQEIEDKVTQAMKRREEEGENLRKAIQKITGVDVNKPSDQQDKEAIRKAISSGVPNPITMSKYTQVQQKMFYSEVVSIMGVLGEEVSSSGLIRTYQWRNSDGSSMTATFEDSRLTAKSQLGLKY